LGQGLVGTWKLVLLEFRSDGQVVYPAGRDATGLLMYDRAGWMSHQLMRPDRPAFASGDQLLGTPEEIKAAFEGYLAYGGTYTVDEAHQVVTHHVTTSLFPNWVGTDQKRFYKLSGARLIISTPTIPVTGHLMDVMLIWQRVA
jgi:hypothetical protein